MQTKEELNKLNELEKLWKFMEKHRCSEKKPSIYTHEILYAHYGKYNIPDSEYNKFMKLYGNTIIKGYQPYIAEKHKDQGPIVMELNFINDNEKRYYNNEMIVKIIESNNKIIRKYLNANSSIMDAYILETETPFKRQEKYHDSVRIMYPYICTKPSLRIVMRESLIKILNKKIPNNWEEIINKEIIYHYHWLMYGSNKNSSSQQHILTHIYCTHNKKIYDSFLPGPIDNKYMKSLINLLSIRKNCSKDTTPLNDEVSPLDIDTKISKSNSDKGINNLMEKDQKERKNKKYKDEYDTILQDKDKLELLDAMLEKLIKGDVIDEKFICVLFYGLYKGRFIYDSEGQKWYSLNEYGIYKDEKSELISAKDLLMNNIHYIVTERFQLILEKINESEKEFATKCYNKFCKYIGKDNNHRAFVSTLKVFCRDPEISKKLNNNINIFPFMNGVYDLKTRKFRNALPEEYVTKTVDYTYEKANEETKVKIRGLINNIFIKEDNRKYVMKTLGLRLRAINNLEEVYFWIGKGRNGKTILASLMEITLYGFTGTLSVDIFTNTKHQSHADAPSPSIAQLEHARAVFITELEKQVEIGAAMIKKFSGGDKMQGRFLRGNPIEFYPKGPLIFLSNESPIIKGGADDATEQRVRFIWFETIFVDNPDPNNPNERKKDPTIKEKLKDEKHKVDYARAFFEILLEYYYDHIDNDDNKLTPPPDVLRETSKFIENNRPVKAFVSYSLVLTKQKTDVIKSSELYEQYCKFNDGKSLGVNAAQFKKELTENFGIESKRMTQGMVYVGIKYSENGKPNNEEMQIEFQND